MVGKERKGLGRSCLCESGHIMLEVLLAPTEMEATDWKEATLRAEKSSAASPFSDTKILAHLSIYEGQHKDHREADGKKLSLWGQRPPRDGAQQGFFSLEPRPADTKDAVEGKPRALSLDPRG